MDWRLSVGVSTALDFESVAAWMLVKTKVVVLAGMCLKMYFKLYRHES
jgi:hypothetical protein